MRVKKLLGISVFVLFVTILFYFGDLDSPTQAVLPMQENISDDVVVSFCPQQDCFAIFNVTLNSAQNEIKCAFYDLDYVPLLELLLAKTEQGLNVSVVVDDSNWYEGANLLYDNSSAQVISDRYRGTKYNNLMHHKFCVVDDSIVLTGSTNPTENGFLKNNNNLLKISSQVLAKDYEEEFDQLLDFQFGPNKKQGFVAEGIRFYHNSSQYEISSYQCPQDECLKPVLSSLQNAQKEILFANFVLTQDQIEQILINKSKKGVHVEGVVEARNVNSEGSRIEELNKTFPVHLDKNSAIMHHKFFIVDNETVITGSMNPSTSGVYYNDENLLVIKSKKITQKYREEFLSLK